MSASRAGLVLLAVTSAFLVEVAPTDAVAADERVEDAKNVWCDSAGYRDTVFRYLTGKPGTGNTKIYTTKTSTLVLDGAQLQVAMPPFPNAQETWGGVVSIPYTSTKPVDVTVDMATSTQRRYYYSITICAYDLKKSAKGWADFQPSDLVPTFGQKFPFGSGPRKVQVPVSDRADTRGSDVIYMDVTHTLTETPSFRATLSRAK